MKSRDVTNWRGLSSYKCINIVLLEQTELSAGRDGKENPKGQASVLLLTKVGEFVKKRCENDKELKEGLTTSFVAPSVVGGVF
ncbi:unnamed protein product [Protopolystoma xenopodis]|uniref:Uncharacterized protein n=1 Tax=Protopolystoma xenopodis TaxID=117903 RepID=A0A3S5FEE9_9PLAT|nr:unnamed protein product [Protopolystoma xenopodis]